MGEILFSDEETFYTKVEIVACGELIVSRPFLSCKSTERLAVCQIDMEGLHTDHSILGREHLQYSASTLLPLVPRTRPSTFLSFFVRGSLGG